jgi:hypothetical protein
VVHGSKQAAGEIVLVDDAVAVQAAEVVDEGVDQRIVQPPDDHGHGVAHLRVVIAGELPCAQMAGEHEDAAAFVAGGEVVLQAVVTDEGGGLGSGVAAHLAELAELPAERTVDPAQDADALCFRLLRKRAAKIFHACPTQPAEEMKKQRADTRTDCACRRARQNPDGSDGQTHAQRLQTLLARGLRSGV